MVMLIVSFIFHNTRGGNKLSKSIKYDNALKHHINKIFVSMTNLVGAEIRKTKQADNVTYALIIIHQTLDHNNVRLS